MCHFLKEETIIKQHKSVELLASLLSVQVVLSILYAMVLFWSTGLLQGRRQTRPSLGCGEGTPLPIP